MQRRLGKWRMEERVTDVEQFFLRLQVRGWMNISGWKRSQYSSGRDPPPIFSYTEPGQILVQISFVWRYTNWRRNPIRFMPCHNQNSRWNNFRLQNSGSAQKCRLHPLFLFTAVQCHAMLVQNKILWSCGTVVLFRFEGAIVVVCIKWSNPRSKQLLWVVPTDVLGFYIRWSIARMEVLFPSCRKEYFNFFLFQGASVMSK